MFEFMTMEETFIASYAIGILLGALLGTFIYFAFERDGNK